MSASKATMQRWRSARLGIERDMRALGLNPESKIQREAFDRAVLDDLRYLPDGSRRCFSANQEGNSDGK